MRKSITGTVAVTLVALTFIAALGPAPRYIEELAIGGGYADPADGGIDLEKDGSIRATGKLTAGASTAARASLALPHGVAPTAPVNGDLWSTTTGLYTQVNGATTGPLLTSATVPWGTPGAIGATTPNSGVFTNGFFTGGIFLTGSTANFDANGAATQLQFYHTKNSGNASIRFQPVPQDGSSQATVDFFRTTNTTGYVALLVKRGDGTNTSIFEVKAGSSPTTYVRNSSGTIKLDIDHNSGNLTASGDLVAKGGDVVAGETSVTRGVIAALDGSGGNTPGCIKLASPNGTIYYLFIEDDGTLKAHSALPSANADGVEVGQQF